MADHVFIRVKKSDFKSIRGLTGWERVKKKRAESRILFLNSLLLLLLFACFVFAFVF